MTDVFLSYSSKDRAAADRIQAALIAAGFDVFWDQEVPPGRDWNGWIGEQLGKARCVVVLWSKASVASRNVVHEATIAMERQALVPALVEDLEASDFPMGFYTTQGADLRGYRGGAHPQMTRPIEAVGSRVGRRAAPVGAAMSDAEKARRLDAIQAQVQRTSGALRKVLLWVGVPVGALVLGLFAYATWEQMNGPEVTVTDMPSSETPGAPAPAAAGTKDALARMLGHWKWDAIACAAGPHVTMEGDRLVYTTSDTRFVHEVTGVEGNVVKTKVLEPADFAGVQYELSPLFFTSSAPRAWQLQVKEVGKDGPPDVRDPCEVE